MAAANRRKMGPREHLGLLFILVLLLSLWFVRHTGRQPVTLSVSETQHAGDPEETAEPNEVESLRNDHSHHAFSDRVAERQRMVTSQIQLRDVKDPNVLKAMQVVPRHAFVPATQQRYAYQDRPLPIGQGQTISQPYIVAFMTDALRLDPNSIVLEIGTGSGYQAAVCAEIARRVYSVEIVAPLAETAAERLKELGYSNVFVRAGDGYYGWPEKGPFDAIIGTAAAGRIPPPLLEQLKRGGRMILPVSDETGFQHLILIVKDDEGQLERQQVMPVRFVPMTGQIEDSN